MKIIAAIALLLLAGCATPPRDPHLKTFVIPRNGGYDYCTMRVP